MSGSHGQSMFSLHKILLDSFPNGVIETFVTEWMVSGDSDQKISGTFVP
jgi:hypothetical protein